MGDWFKRVTATAAGRLLAWLVISAVTTTGLGLSLASSWQYVKAAPQPILILSLAGFLLSAIFVVFFAWAFLCTQIHDGTFGSKYLLWYKLPIRKVSWSFDQFLGAASGHGQPVLIYAFQPQLKVNWGDGIHPKKAFIECRTTGALQAVLLSPQNTYVSAEAVEFIPKGGWFPCQALFGGITKEAFLQNWDGFNFVFEYDDKRFSRRFSRTELEECIDRFWRYSNRRAKPKGRLRHG